MSGKGRGETFVKKTVALIKEPKQYREKERIKRDQKRENKSREEAKAKKERLEKGGLVFAKSGAKK